jgi:hypothetical protein
MGEWRYYWGAPCRSLVRWVLRDVVCPHCGAETGQPCLRPNGTPMTSEHARRKAASESVRRFTP